MPFVAVDYWWIRMFDFPHLQLTGLTLLALLIYFIKFDFKDHRDYFLVGSLLLCFIFQFIKIYPYTPLADFEVLETENNDKSISLFTSNVLQKNEKHHLLQEVSNKYDADVLLFTETDRTWKNEITANLDASYKNKVEVPLDNTYGMLLYSKLDIFDTQVKYLVSDSIPSIHTKVRLASNDTIQLYAIHPTPPMPQENPSSSDRDTEMMLIAKMALESKYPVIVVGDFNDVAWSETSKLFQSVSRLLDIRKGRGFFNTYNAENFLFRWPLDHIFISSEFRLNKVKLAEDINSDHFPLYTELSFEPGKKNMQSQAYPTDSQLKNAQQQIDDFNKAKREKAKKRNRTIRTKA